MATESEVQEKLLDQILAAASESKHPVVLLQLAEAFAWVVRPGNSHGGSVKVTS